MKNNSKTLSKILRNFFKSKKLTVEKYKSVSIIWINYSYEALKLHFNNILSLKFALHLTKDMLRVWEGTQSIANFIQMDTLEKCPHRCQRSREHV